MEGEGAQAGRRINQTPHVGKPWNQTPPEARADLQAGEVHHRPGRREITLASSTRCRYSQACADNPRYTIEGVTVREQLGKIIRRYVDPHKIGQRNAEGLDAMKTKFFEHEGLIADRCDRVAWSERRAYTAVAAEYAGYIYRSEEVDDGSNVSELSSRSDEELEYYIAHGTWPGDKTPPS